MIARLTNERGITLLETLATTVIMGFAMISLYIGILYCDKQVQRNYHDRVATLHASGELDWQTYYKRNYKEFQTFQNRPVVLDRMERGRILYGQMSASTKDAIDNSLGLLVPYTTLEIVVKWQEIGDNKTRSVVYVEDFF